MPQRSLIFAPMKKALYLVLLLAVPALPSFAQTTFSEFGITLGGTRRTASNDELPDNAPSVDGGFSFENSSVEIYYGVEIEPGSMFKLKAGRMEAPVSFQEQNADGDLEQVVYNDGTVENVSGVVEYRFSEAFGSTSLFGGVGLYRHSADGARSSTNYGFSGGVNADFPLSRRYGIKVEGTYHWVSHEYRPRYITLGAGLRVSF
jgi:hypothetical protein